MIILDGRVVNVRQVARLVDDVDRGSSLVYGRQGGAVEDRQFTSNQRLDFTRGRLIILDGRVVNVRQVARLIDDVDRGSSLVYGRQGGVVEDRQFTSNQRLDFSRGLIVRLDDCVVNVRQVARLLDDVDRGSGPIHICQRDSVEDWQSAIDQRLNFRCGRLIILDGRVVNVRQVARLIDDVDRGSGLVYGRQRGIVKDRQTTIDQRLDFSRGRLIGLYGCVSYARKISCVLDNIDCGHRPVHLRQGIVVKNWEPTIDQRLDFSRRRLIRLDDRVVNVRQVARLINDVDRGCGTVDGRQGCVVEGW